MREKDQWGISPGHRGHLYYSERAMQFLDLQPMGNKDSGEMEIAFLGSYLITRVISFMLWVTSLGPMFMLMISL